MPKSAHHHLRRAGALVSLVVTSILASTSPAGAHPGVPGEQAEPAGLVHWLTSGHHLLIAVAIAAVVIVAAVAVQRARRPAARVQRVVVRNDDV